MKILKEFQGQVGSAVFYHLDNTNGNWKKFSQYFVVINVFDLNNQFIGGSALNTTSKEDVEKLDELQTNLFQACPLNHQDEFRIRSFEFSHANLTITSYFYVTGF